MKLDRLILKKIIKIVATRCQILRLKCTKIDFGCWENLQRSPDPLAGFEGPTSKGRGEGEGLSGGEGVGRGGEGEKGGESEGRTPWYLLTPPDMKSQIKPCM